MFKTACFHCRGHGFNPWVRKIPLEKEAVTDSSVLAWENPWPGAWWATVHGVAKSDRTWQLNNNKELSDKVLCIKINKGRDKYRYVLQELLTYINSEVWDGKNFGESDEPKTWALNRTDKQRKLREEIH